MKQTLHFPPHQVQELELLLTLRFPPLQVEELGLELTLPSGLLATECAVRVMNTQYDHFSKFADTADTPDVAPPTDTLTGDTS